MEGHRESMTVSLRELPVGYRFKPTEEELITCYLMKKVKNQPLPHRTILEVNVYEHSPKELVGKYLLRRECEWFFFSPRNRKYPNGSRPDRSARDGYWKMTGCDTEIMINGVKAASRKNLDYYTGSHKQGQKTNWKMQEYVLEEDATSSGFKRDNDRIKLNEWVICKIYESNRSKQRNNEIHTEEALWMRDPTKEDENEDGSLKEEYFNKELPPGYRFKPTEEELVIYYLNKKVFNQPLSPHKIREHDIYKHTPEELTGKIPIYREDEWFVFSSRYKKYPNGARPDRATGNGFWKVTSTDLSIVVDGTKVASKRRLDYFTGTYKENQKTIWKMHEYILEEQNPREERNEGMLNDLVLCKIYKNKTKQPNENAVQIQNNQDENEVTNGHDTNSAINNESNVLGEKSGDSFFWDYDEFYNRNSGMLPDIVFGNSTSRQRIQNQTTEFYPEPQNSQQNTQKTMTLDFDLVDELKKIIGL
ncbi:hypothetical protein VNO77_16772 [Canavalia gladiata]|uniref:NAC domain-containing protein n=1 Tax=Canavalia gladiata TaxID=3824 RepID=A0AAN9LIF2_CANGL